MQSIASPRLHFADCFAFFFHQAMVRCTSFLGKENIAIGKTKFPVFTGKNGAAKKGLILLSEKAF